MKLTLTKQEAIKELQEKHPNYEIEITERITDVGKTNEYLKLLKSDIQLSKTTGNKTIYEAKNIFASYIDEDFKDYLDNKQSATKETTIQVYEMAKNANYSQMFGSLNDDLDSLCLTQNQIINFCEKHLEYLKKDSDATFFLFKENGEYFVARVYVNSDGLSVRVHRFEDDYVWDAEYALRVVGPQLGA